ncbi:MAG: glycoside hydrolase family 27 protein, partial [Oscillospiraceae bacterium]|nr:glycoside hydrolase family 27 protein [Oscillospiraceae bacterium]
MLAQKPPMGWNSWNTFGENISEELLMQTADAIAASGLKEAGYEYVVIDDCWSLRERDADGNLAADPAKFPRGMKFLADYIHSRGLKFGMYSCAGTLTCAGYPSSFDHEFQDAKRFADWGVDFLKYDFCNKPSQSFGPLLYHRMGIALKASGREILFSACNWGSDEVEKWIRSSGAHMYRSTGDIGDSFVSFKDIALSQVSKLCCAAPGCFNDLDMLIVGMYGKGNVAVSGCTDAEYLMHFALWCMMASPLMIGCDVRSMSDATKATLLNKELLRINQDAEARPAYRLHVHGGGETLYLFRHLENNEYALAAFNFGEHSVNNYVDFFEAGIPATSGYGMKLTEVLS